MSQSLAMKYRPQTLEEILGQSITVEILKRSVEKMNFKHAYLFAGPSGTGKTTCARAFAKAINGGIGDPIELDAASNGSIDQIRAIVDSANQRSLTCKYKIFIIDECHAISTAGFQVFLKCLEECPEYTIFMFCTTEPNKIPTTILNRVQRYNLAPISIADITARLCYICENEGFINYKDACDYIAKMSNGEMRAAITYLEQCADYSTDLAIDNIKAVLGDISYETMLTLTNVFIDGNLDMALKFIDKQVSNGVDMKQFVATYLEFSIELTKYIMSKNIACTNIPSYLISTMVGDTNTNIIDYTTGIDNNKAWFTKLTDKLFELKSLLRNDQNFITTIKVFFMQICRGI